MPPPSLTTTTAPEPSPIGSPRSAGARVTIDAGGRYHCDWVAGCAPFVAIEPTDGIVVDPLSEGWLPLEPYLLDGTPISGGHGDLVASVGGPTRPVDALQPGTYQVTAGSLWVDDTATTSEGPNAPNVFMRTGGIGPCQAPLVVAEATEQVSIAATFHEDTFCQLEIHAGSGARLDVEMAGTVHCTLFPSACAATLSILPVGTVVDDDWRPGPHDPWWGAAASGVERLGPIPVWTVPDLPPGRHRLLISLLGHGDTPSSGPNGRPATDLLSRCSLDVDVAPGTERVGIVVTFEPDGSQWGGSCEVSRSA